MALTYAGITLLCELRRLGIVGQGKTPSLLEMGEQNWYGDVNITEIQRLVGELPEGDTKVRLLERYTQITTAPGREYLFDLAKLFYAMIFDHERYRAIDFDGTDIAERHDLNQPLPFDEQFSVVTNIGTAEHIFNQYQVFQSIHERTMPGGLMIHWLPHQGCYDHGFYNYHPTFVFDLSRANNYELISLLYCDLTAQPPKLVLLSERRTYVELALGDKVSRYCGLLVAARKPAENAPFRVPQQGYYNNALPPELVEAWSRLPR